MGDGGAKRGRVTAHYIVHRSSGLEEDDGRRKTLAEKTWARHTSELYVPTVLPGPRASV